MVESKADVETGKNDPQTLASEKLGKLLTNYPKGHPSYQKTSDEKLEDLSKIKLDDINKFYKDFYGANNSISAFVGQLDKKQINTFLQNTFANWNSKESFAVVVPKYFETKGTTESINTPDKTSAIVLGAININVSEKHPDFPAMYMANELLGGGAFLSSRIPQRLRENEGMSYGAGTFMNSNYNYDYTNWGVYAIFNPLYKGRLDSALQQEIDKARTGGFTKEELEKSKISWLEQNKSSLGMNSFLANQLRWYMRDGRSLDDFTSFENKINGLSLESVNAALRKYFDKSKLVLIYGGEFDKGKTDKTGDKKGF